MSKNLIPDADIEKALDYLVSHAGTAAQARANRLYLEDYSKVVKSKVMQRNTIHPLGTQEREAYASRDYQEHLLVLKQAIEDDEKARYLREAAQAKIEAWRTMCATERAHKI